jgi:hypothetical protein
MRKNPTIEKALATVALLGGKTQPTAAQVAKVADDVSNWQTVNAKMATVPASEAGLCTLRAMLACELARGDSARDMIIYRIVARHEQLSKQIRFAAMVRLLPSIESGLRRTATA